MTKFQKHIITLYRYLAILILGGVLSTAMGYVVVTLFYTVNSSWISPVVISPTHEKILRLSAELFRTQQSADSLDALVASLTDDTKLLEQQFKQLAPLVRASAGAVLLQAKSDKGMAGALNRIVSAKNKQATDSAQLLQSLAETEPYINAELSAGLTTRQDATSARIALLSYRAAATEAQVSRIATLRQIEELKNSASTFANGTGASLAALDVSSKLLESQHQVAGLEFQIIRNKADIATKTTESKKLRRLIATLSDSPYYKASQGGGLLSFAFVPYENAAKVGQPVFDCALHMVFCSKVGVISKVYLDEERAQHPLFRMDTRGTLAELSLTDVSAAKSRVMFVGRPPLVF